MSGRFDTEKTTASRRTSMKLKPRQGLLVERQPEAPSRIPSTIRHLDKLPIGWCGFAEGEVLGAGQVRTHASCDLD